MPFTLVSHFKLRNIPWDMFASRVIGGWQPFFKGEDQWSPEELAGQILRADGLGGRIHFQLSQQAIQQIMDDGSLKTNEVTADLFGFERNFSYRDGTTFRVRCMAHRDADGLILADLYTTLDLTQDHKLQCIFFAPVYLIGSIALESSGHYALHRGAVPDSLYTDTPKSSLRREIFRSESDQHIETWYLYHPEDLPQEKTNVPAPSEKPSEKVETGAQESDSKRTEGTADQIPQLEKELEEERRKSSDLAEQLEESASENEAMAEQLEECRQQLHELQESRKKQNRTIGEQKDKIERLKNRLKQADKRANMNADEKFSAFCEDFDQENEKLRSEIRSVKVERDELQQKLQEAEGKVVSLKGRLGKASSGISGGLLNLPSEEEKFDSEFGIALFSALHKAIEKTPNKTNSFGNRSIDMWKAFIKANPDMEQAFQNYKEIKEQLMIAMKGDQLDRNLHLLAPLGMKFSTHTNCHGKITFKDDDQRYKASTASTASETASGPSNSAKDLKNAFLYPT